MILWFIGISGSGKSTLGNALKRALDGKKVPNAILDGDVVRKFFDHDLGYSRENRMANIKRIQFAAHVLSENNMVTIVCNICPFQELRDFSRAKFHDYNEIYLQKDLNRSIHSDVKSVYKKHHGKTAIIGLDIPFDEPVSCDLRIDVDTLTVDQSLEKVNQYLRAKYPSWPL